MNLSIRLLILLKGTFIGKDDYGNRYFEERAAKKNHKKRRWILYVNLAEATKIPPDWHGWIHYVFDAPPISNVKTNFMPNMTGTPLKYTPPLAKGAVENLTCKTKMPYKSWKPKSR